MEVDHNLLNDVVDDSDLDRTHMTEFVKEGEIIQMEINDGGAAAQEFASDNEYSDEETASDGEMDMTVSQTMENHANSDHSDNDQQIEEYNTVEYKCKQAEKRSKKAEGKSMEEKLDSLSSTLEVMKDFFIKGGLNLPSSSNTDKNIPARDAADHVKAKAGKELINR